MSALVVIHLRPVFNTTFWCLKFTANTFGSFTGSAVERRTVNRGDSGSVPPAAVSKIS